MTEHVDMAQFVEAKSDQLNSDDLIGGPRTITITAVRGCDGDQPIAISYQGDGGKPWKPCKTMRRVLLAIWGREAANYVGRSLTIYRDDSVTFGGLNVGGIRISHMSHMEKETVVVVMKTKGKKAGIKVSPLKAAAPRHDPETGEIHEDTPPPKAKQTAEEWTNDYVTKVATCTTTEELIALQQKSANALTKLATGKPELHETAVKAGAAKASELEQEFAA